jgi:hypothetical protein
MDPKISRDNPIDWRVGLRMTVDFCPFNDGLSYTEDHVASSGGSICQ